MKTVCLLFSLFFVLEMPLLSQEILHDTPEVIIGKCLNGTELYTQLSYTTNNKDTIYTFTLRKPETAKNNLAGDSYSSLQFYGNSVLLNQLYTTLKSVFPSSEKKQKLQNLVITLGNRLVVINKERVMGETAAAIYLPNGYGYLTEWQLDKLFGKT